MRYFIVLLLISQLALAQTRTLRTFSGTAGNYPASLTLTTFGSLAHGTLTYGKPVRTVRVIGAPNAGKLSLFTHSPNATINELLYGKLTDAGFTGQYVLSMDKVAPFTLKQTRQQAAPMPKPTTLTGTYVYQYESITPGELKGANSGQLYVQQLPNGQVSMAVRAVMGAPGYNQAGVEKTTFAVKNNQVTFSPDPDMYSGCRLRVTFFAEGASIVHVGNDQNCGFGNGADITGVYLKVSQSPGNF